MKQIALDDEARILLFNESNVCFGLENDRKWSKMLLTPG